MASPKTAADDAMVGFDGEADGESALTVVKREFANLDEDDEELPLAKKICASRELSSDHATNTIFNQRSSLKDRNHTISALKASLHAIKGELEWWTSGFSNDSLRQRGASPDPAVAVRALQKLLASESPLKEQSVTRAKEEKDTVKPSQPQPTRAGWLFLGRPQPNPPEDPTTEDLTTGVRSECRYVNETNVVPKASSQRTLISISDVQYPVPLPPRRPVTMEERRRAELTARTLKTTNPSVMVVLTKSSVQCHFSLTIPSAFAKQWLPRALAGVTLCDSTGQNSTARGAGNRKSPCLKGFKAFALTHYLEGDVLVFELTDSNPGNPAFFVQVFRIVELSNNGYTSQGSDNDGCLLLTESENDSDFSKSRQNEESNIGEGASATPNHGKGFCADVLPLATRVPKTEVFNDCPVSEEAATLDKNFKTGSVSHPPEDEKPGK